jgi:oligoribonuclease
MAQEKNDKRYSKLYWIDMEMTGLDEKTCQILEAAAVVTDLELNILDEVHRVVHQPQSVLDGMDDWCKKTHGKSGLTAEVPNGRPLAEVESAVVALATTHFGNDPVVLCGNSVDQDRRFIKVYMPAFFKRLHYRLIDVSSFKEVFRNKYGTKFDKKDTHRAREDIFESIAELKFYLSFVKLGTHT